MRLNRLLFTLMVGWMACCAMARTNVVSISDFAIAPDSTVTVPVKLANQDTTRGLQFNLTLPPGLTCRQMELSTYIKRLRFVLNNTFKDDHHTVMIYQVGAGVIPPGCEAVLLMTLHADHGFTGGEITVWKCRGSTRDNKSINMDGDTVAVTVPMGAQGDTFMDAAPAGD